MKEEFAKPDILQAPSQVAGFAPKVLQDALRDVFGFEQFRKHQEEVCEATLAGSDILLVMPTGAGKSLCYQLPTVASPGAKAVVITPLLALIEDQVEKLQRIGVSADRIHSGRSRAQSQDACRAWREGSLRFLFVAPERFAVPGFLEFLELYLPDTIAVDEAHCISCWGHDFRPDYRMLGPRLARLRPANVVAVTATATTHVQKDILVQLGISAAKVFIHGFRRTNIAIDVLSVSPGARAEACKVLLRGGGRLPAIIYAPTRKLAEATAEALMSEYRVRAYHAGFSASDRQMIQNDFLTGNIDVMVATIEFGMGIDKPNIRTVVHMALPSSLEGYYQEIGRAGRDGKPSEAVMMYSSTDMKTHEYFFDQNYPTLEVLQGFAARIPLNGIERGTLLQDSNLDELKVNQYLEKLWIHGGILVDEQGLIRKTNENWAPRYFAQRKHKLKQMDGVLNFVSTKKCRMRQLVDHFGDSTDFIEHCQICDVCMGKNRVVRPIQTVSIEDQKLQNAILLLLSKSVARTFGQVFKEIFEPLGWKRHQVNGLVDELEERGLLKCRSDHFEKDGKTMAFKWLEITSAGRVWLHQAGLSSSLKEQMNDLKMKEPAAMKRRNSRRKKTRR